ncbi:MAG TPA: serine protease [Kofleriaceae bacterium]|nr:serine protease [Kofleriaceae bacterium]
MTLRDDAHKLRLVAIDAGGTLIDKVVERARNDLPVALFDKLPARNPSAAVAAERDIDALAALPARSEEGLQIWIAAARRELGRRTERADRLAAAADDPGRDPSLRATYISRQEKTKLEFADDLVTVQWFSGGRTAAPSVGYLYVPRFFDGDPRPLEVPAGGTCFLIAPDLVMTAFHVVEARDRHREPVPEAPAEKADLDLQVAALRIMFDYEKRDANDKPKGTELKATELVAFDAALDVAVLRLAEPIPAAAATPLSFRQAPLPDVKKGVGFVANIIQHPNHEPKKVGLRGNAVWSLDEKQIYYFTDTRGGSSGAPVFDDAWQVIAIHTGFDPVEGEEPVYLGRKFAVVNRGTLATRLITHFNGHATVKLTIG